MGRPSKLTPALQEKICGYIAGGNTYAVSCRMARLGVTTFCRWRATGENAKSGKYREFWQAVKDADASFEAKHLKRIEDASLCDVVIEREVTKVGTNGQEYTERYREVRPPPWQPSAWLLERTRPNQFGRTVQRVEHEGRVGVELSAAAMTDEEVEAVIARISGVDQEGE